MIRRIFLIIIYISISTYAIASTFPAKHSIIIDTDVGIDDVIGIMYLLNRHDIDVKAITIDGDGNAHCKPAVNNALGVLRLMNKPSIAVACASEKPLQGNHHFIKSVLLESDTLSGASALLPKNSSQPSTDAITLLINTLTQAKQTVDILAIGPLTNIASAIQKAPEIKSHIHMIYMMAGAVHVRGNIKDVDATLDNTVAEWNIYIDPYAADIVFKSGIPITLVPLDATNQAPVDWGFYQTINRNQKTPAMHFAYEMLRPNETYIKKHEWYNWDSLAAVIVSNNSIAKMVKEKVKIQLFPENISGQTIIDNKNGSKIIVCESIDRRQFQELLLKSLSDSFYNHQLK